MKKSAAKRDRDSLEGGEVSTKRGRTADNGGDKGGVGGAASSGAATGHRVDVDSMRVVRMRRRRGVVVQDSDVFLAIE